MNHSLISASGNTHAKIAVLAVVASVVFVTVVSASGITRFDNATVHGPIVKAATITTIAGSTHSAVR